MQGQEVAPVMGAMFVLFVLLGLFIALLVTILTVWIHCRIFSKAGYSWTLGLLMFVPVANIIMPFVLAFGDWPIYRELRRLRGQQQSG